MHHLTLEEWSRGNGPLHARDARAKILVLVSYLVALGTTPVITLRAALVYGALAAAALWLARLPIGGVLVRAAVVAPFAGVFAAMALMAGDNVRAWAILVRSYLSAVAVLVLAGSTPLPRLLGGLDGLGTPRFLTLVVQFLYRYLFVLSEQAQHMRLAAAGRGAAFGGRNCGKLGFRAAAGALTVLFARSLARAHAVHRAMLARGFQGSVPTPAAPAFRLADGAFLAVGVALCAAARVALGM